VDRGIVVLFFSFLSFDSSQSACGHSSRMISYCSGKHLLVGGRGGAGGLGTLTPFGQNKDDGGGRGMMSIMGDVSIP